MFYNVIPIKDNEDFQVRGDILSVNVNSIKHNQINSIENDENFLESSAGKYTWVSGGGTYFLNKRFIIILKRGNESKINPDKFSLFTGRSDSLREQLNPSLLIRELFEELILFSDGKLLYPKIKTLQGCVDKIYKNFDKYNIVKTNESNELYLTEYKIDSRKVKFTGESSEIIKDLTWHINSQRDINILFLFESKIDIEKLSSIDGEYFIANEKLNFLNRDIFLLDIHTNKIANLSISDELKFVSVDLEKFTDHLRYVYDHLRRNYENNC